MRRKPKIMEVNLDYIPEDTSKDNMEYFAFEWNIAKQGYTMMFGDTLLVIYDYLKYKRQVNYSRKDIKSANKPSLL